MIERKEYLEKLKKWKDKDLIKVITGIRRCGKSTLFDIYIDYLKSIGIKDKKQYYVFLDEVQKVSDFQKAVDGLYIMKNVDVYITGSNAYLLSGELATLLTGRYIEIKMYL